MNLVDVSVSKIIYSHSDKKYKIIFTQVLKEKHFAIFLSSEYAKKITKIYHLFIFQYLQSISNNCSSFIFFTIYAII